MTDSSSTSTLLWTVATVLCACAATVYLFFRHKFNYWAARGVPTVQPLIPVGNLKNFGKTGHSSQVVREFYQQLRGRGSTIGGLYFFTEPVLLLLELEAVKAVLIKDFHNFPERGIYYNEKDDPLSAHMFALDGPAWRRVRSKLTPTFTSGKMKFMFTTVVDVAERFQLCLSELIAAPGADRVLEMRELLARFTTDVIGTCAFGIECNSLKDPNAKFREMGRKVFAEPRNRGLKSFLILSFRHVARRLRMKVQRDDVSEFFMDIVRQTIEYREKGGVRRNDFMDLLIELKNEQPKDGGAPLSVEEVAAQAFVFFLAGFETSSTTLSYALYELSLNVEIQQRARDEVKSVLARHGGEMTYEAMMEMHYVEQILNESMRKYPPVSGLIRRCREPYTFADSGVHIEPETLVLVPVYSIHHDPEYYPEPERFDPDRFSAERIHERPHETFLSFGIGPRNCIGLRFGMMQARVGLAKLLQNFEISTCARSVVPLKFSKTSIILTPEDGLFLEFKKL